MYCYVYVLCFYDNGTIIAHTYVRLSNVLCFNVKEAKILCNSLKLIKYDILMKKHIDVCVIYLMDQMEKLHEGRNP